MHVGSQLRSLTSEEQVSTVKGEEKSKLSKKLYRLFPHLQNLNTGLLCPSKVCASLSRESGATKPLPWEPYSESQR